MGTQAHGTHGTPQIRAAVLHGAGQVPRYELFPAPVAGPGQAVVTVTAAALKPDDRLTASGAARARPASYPVVAGTDGAGRLPDGRRVVFYAPQPPYGGMAEAALVHSDAWFPVPDGIDDVTAAAVASPGLAAWKALIWDGRLAAGERVLVLGATGTSGRIAAQLARQHGARVVVAGRSPRVLGQLAGRGAEAALRVDRPLADLTAAIAAAGPYDLIVDYLWGKPAEAAFAALLRAGPRPAGPPERTRYLQVGLMAGETAAVPALALRAGRVELAASRTGGQPALADAVIAFAGLVAQVASGDIAIDIDAVPLAGVEQAWPNPRSGQRIVFVP